MYVGTVELICAISTMYVGTVELTCALSTMYVGTGLVAEKKARFVRAGVDPGHRAATFSGTSVVCEGKGWTARERAFRWPRVGSEHRVKCGISSDLATQVVQTVPPVAVRWNKRLQK
jgi:hypothetical protein